MKYHEKTLTAVLTAVLAACVLLSACSSSGSDAATPEDTPTVENVTTGPTAEPTTSSSEPGGTLQLDEVNDDDLIAAALAAYETAPQPEGTIAWDVLDTSVFEDQVSFTMCTWDGLTANDAMRDIKYITTITDGGTIEARNVQSSPTSGDCLNTQLIESAIATANFQEEFWESVALAPETFVDSDVPAQLFTDFGFENSQTLANQWLADDVIVRGTRSGSIPEDLVAPLAWRRYSDDKNQSVLELVSCMPMDPTYGLYRGDLLLDDYKGGSVNGPHRVDLYRLVASPGGSLGWRVDGTAGSGWGDCFNTGDWLGAVGDWQPSSPSWALLES
ncbi:hypothetical protein N9R50_02875 [bacterium]|nr:hypothetical protein [bacterium]MDB9846375.1 hypothetical protein [Acidimicrobiales bacterium]